MMELEGSEVGPSGGKKPARIRRSCEACRIAKGKCVPVEGGDGGKRCKRCVKERLQCVYLEARPRPKRSKNSRVRVAEMEVKLDGLLSLLAQRQAGTEGTAAVTPSESSSAPASSLPAASLDLVGANTQTFSQSFTLSSSSMSSPRPSTLPYFPHIQTAGSFVSSESWTSKLQANKLKLQPMLGALSFPPPDFLFPNFDPFNDVISKGIIDFEQAEESVHLFKSKASQFPFVLAPPNMSLDSLRRERSFLLLSILTFAASSNEKLQLQLELELRESLSKRVIVHGEKSLDLLQGVLLYLAWYHFYFDPCREQIYQLSQMAAAMAIDLGINNPTQDSAIVDCRSPKSKPIVFLTKKSPEELETQRTFLGCYFVTSSICNGLRKPNSLKYCDYVDTCSESLVCAANAETDYLLPYHIRLQRLGEEIEQAFDYSQTQKLPQLDPMRVEILVKSFEQQLRQIESTFPSDVWNNPALTLRFYNLRIYANEVGFHATKPSDTGLISGMATIRSWNHSIARSKCLIRCLQATKDYLDRYLTLSSDELANFILPDFGSLVYAVLILGAFATGGPDSPALDTEHMKQSANLDSYLDALSGQVFQAIAASKPGSNNYMEHMYGLFQQSKNWYTQMTKDPTPDNLCNARFSFMEIIPTIVGRCVDFGLIGTSDSSSGLSDTFSDEQWTEILSSWATGQDISNMALDTTLN